jgi:hypothetical protein
MKRFVLGACVVLLAGCQTIGNWADDVGQHLPVVGDNRCEHWQCFTDEGKAQSDYNKMMLQKRWEQEKLEEEMEKKGIQPSQPASPPKYNPPPEMNPYDQYHP